MRRGFANLVGGLALASVLAIGNPFAAYATGDVADSTSIDVVGNEISTQAEGDVAQIGDKTYATLDEAIADAEEGATIELLGDAMTEGMNLHKSVTIQAASGLTDAPQIIFTNYGIALGYADGGKKIDLVFKDVNVVMNGVGSTPVTAEWGWMSICASQGATMTLDNVDMTMDADGASGSPHAIYFCQNNVLNVINGSNLTIKNYPNDALEWDGGDGGYNVNITDSMFISDHNRSGFTGTFVASIKNSDVDVINSRGNGSNGSHFIIDKSEVTFSDNTDHGLSTGMLTIQNKSNVVANGNGRTGVHVGGGDFNMDGTSTLTTNNNGAKNWGAGVNLTASGKGEVAAGAIIEIVGNGGDGLDNQRTTVIHEGAEVTITNNSDGNGGGIYNPGNLTLPSDAKVYNNHASTSGDDIYSTGTITFGQVGDGWKLDGVDCDGNPDDCTDTIDGWYDDSKGARWEAHADSYDDIHVEEYAVQGTTTVTGTLCLKAAHGLGTVAVTPADITIYMGGDEGYEGTATDDGTITGSNSLPEPGFYLTLSEDINAALQKAGHATEGEAADLSQFLKLYTVDYTVDGEATTLNWKLENYGETHSGANNKFIYRIVPAPTEGQEAVPVRLQFTSPDGSQTFTNDTFDPSQTDTLYQQYTMQLYTNLVDANQVVFEVEVDGEHFYNTMKLETGELTIRYVTGDQDSVVSDVVTSASELAAAKAENPDKAYALHSERAKFFINGSQVDVTDDATPSLLFDDVVSDNNTDGAADYDQQLANRATDVIRSQGSTLVNPWFQAKYLDLVDANNGNTWLTSNEATTVYWPYPAGTDENTEFHLVHFEGLNREISNGEIADQIAGANAEYVAVENTEHGIRFQTDGFSPFVLIWDAGEDAGEQPEPQPPVTKGESGGLPTTGDYTLMGAAVAAIAGVAALGYGIYASKRTH